MNKLKTILVAGFMAITAPSFAQFLSAENAEASNFGSYNRVEFSFNPVTISYDYKYVDNINLSGFSLGYIRGISVSKNIPLYIEVGGHLTYAFKSQDAGDYSYKYEGLGDIKTKYLGITVPANISYKFTMPNGKVSIVPFFGLSVKANLIAKQKIEWSKSTKNIFSSAYNTTLKDVEFNMFDEDDMGEDDTWNRLQLGCNTGVGVNYKAFYAGMNYAADLTKIAKKTRTFSWAITVGYNF